MKAIIASIAIFILASIVLAQIEPDNCVYCNCVDDATCTAGILCNSSATNDCSSKTFSVTCGGTYYLRAALLCSSGAYCDDCCAYARIVGPTGLIVECHLECVENNCKYDCQTSLEADVSYTLYSCFRVCENHTCNDCAGGSCSARAFVFKNASDPCPSPCN